MRILGGAMAACLWFKFIPFSNREKYTIKMCLSVSKDSKAKEKTQEQMRTVFSKWQILLCGPYIFINNLHMLSVYQDN